MGGKNSYESIKRYEDKAYDKILVRLPKGRKAEIKAHADIGNESVNGFIARAIDQTIAQDGTEASTRPPQAAEGNITSEALKAAQGAAEATGEAIPQFVERAVVTQVDRDRRSLTMGINPATGEKMDGGDNDGN